MTIRRCEIPLVHDGLHRTARSAWSDRLHPTLENHHDYFIEPASAIQHSEGRQAASLLKGRLRAGLVAAIIAGVIMCAPMRGQQQVRSTDCKQEDCAPGKPKVDLAFILDSSGSLDAGRLGQTYNVQVEGVLRALRDPSVIARDGSVAVAVETFAGSATIQSAVQAD